MNNKQKTEEWEKEFNKRWNLLGFINFPNGQYQTVNQNEEIKSFIRRLLIEEKVRWLEELKKTRI